MPGLATMGGAAQAVAPLTQQQPFFTPERSQAFMGLGDILQGGTGQAFLPGMQPGMQPGMGGLPPDMQQPGMQPGMQQPGMQPGGGLLSHLLRLQMQRR